MMSFSASVKQELFRKENRAGHCRIAELSGILSVTDQLPDDPEYVKSLTLHIENPQLRGRVFTLLRKTFKIGTYDQTRKDADPRSLELRIEDAKEAETVYTALRIRDDADLMTRICERTCCRRAFLRGAFLAGGSVSDPEKSYHFEIVCPSPVSAQQICRVIREFDLDARFFMRKKRCVVYVKEGTQIVDLLNVMGADVSLMQMENVRIVKDVRNRVNRQVNCETANLTKTVNASVRETEEIRRLEEAGLLETLPQALRETARLRLENPEASLRELGEMHDPPIGRSGVNHRLKKISEIASGAALCEKGNTQSRADRCRNMEGSAR